MFLVGVNLVQTQSLPISDLWYFLPIGYLLTVLIETPILLIGLCSKLSIRQKLLCGVWLTACTYPIVVLVLPTLFFGQSRLLYLAVAEIFAPAAECALFWLAFRGREALTSIDWFGSSLAIVVANLASFSVGEVFNYYGWFGLF
jgi:hypothetical protein